jgi:quinol-cytochrome oxidoreductase complex cytochrome b subunit
MFLIFKNILYLNNQITDRPAAQNLLLMPVHIMPAWYFRKK